MLYFIFELLWGIEEIILVSSFSTKIEMDLLTEYGYSSKNVFGIICDILENCLIFRIASSLFLLCNPSLRVIVILSSFIRRILVPFILASVRISSFTLFCFYSCLPLWSFLGCPSQFQMEFHTFSSLSIWSAESSSNNLPSFNRQSNIEFQNPSEQYLINSNILH